MKIFQDYARFYDSLYKNKDYRNEACYLEKLFKKYSSKKTKTVLDLGCGTGSHALILAKKGYKITGVDLSKKMLKIARKKAKEKKLKINFRRSDIRKLDLKKKFDAIISMFAVIGYQKTNDGLEKALMAAHKHLKNRGLFIFDVWFGPAVLEKKPKEKIKKVRLKNGYVIRQTKPRLNLLKQTVDVFFKTKYYSDNRRLLKINRETHEMRFFFYQEISYFLQKAGFSLVKILPFLKLKGVPSRESWNITVIARK